MSQAGPARWAPAFVVLSAIWGSSFALIKVAVEAGVSPLWVALWRCALGAAALAVVCALTRTALPRQRASWGHAAVVAALLNAAPFVLFAYGEQHVSSVVAGVVNATTPLLTLVFVMMLMPTEKASATRLAGLVLGLLGVACVLGIWRGIAAGDLRGALACLGATTCYGAGFAYTRRFFSTRDEAPMALAAAQLICASAQLGAVAAIVQPVPTWPGWTPAAALVALGAIGTGYAYVLNLRVVRAAGATTASTVTYVVPLWSTAIGAVALSEPVGWNTLAGAALIITGILTARARTTRPAASRAEADPRR